MSKAAGKVLLVEDDEVQGEIVKELLLQQGYEVDYFALARQAMAASESTLYDLALIDIYLPDASGLEILDALRRGDRHKTIPILMMTADATEETAVMALVKEADEVIVKPLRHAEFLLKIKLWFDRAHERIKLNESHSRLEAQSKIMSQYFSDDIIEKITASGAMMEPEIIKASIMFFDLRSFTSLSESLDPHDVANLLNILFTDLMDLIFSHGGSVNKFIGDAIMATFGAPLSQGNDALNAVKCALAIRESMDLFNQVKPDYLKNDLGYGIGVATGKVFSGTVGSFRRLEYTVLGDIVNVASRLESMNKISKTNVLIDGSTYADVTNFVDCRKIKFKETIRGKVNEVEIYEPKNLKV